MELVQSLDTGVARVLPDRDERVLHLMSSQIFFFFSSRRRHTRYWRDWSSDVCSSDLLVVGDILLSHVRRVLVAKPLKEPPELLLGEQEEQHQGIGLLGELIAVGCVSFGPEDAVESLDVAVLCAVGLPVQLLELLIALELADDAIAVERYEHLVAHFLPRVDLVFRESNLGAQ